MAASSTEITAVKAFAEAYRTACAAGPQTYTESPTCPECGSEVDGDEVTRTEFHPFYDALMIAWPHLSAMAWAERHAGVVLTRRGRNLLATVERVGYAPLGLTSEETCERMLIGIHAIAAKLSVEIPKVGAR